MGRQGLDILDETACRALLDTHSFGRVGVKRADELLVVPVFYAYVDDSVVFRTAPGTKLDAGALKTKMVFEIDDVHEGWSVLVNGHAEEVRDRRTAEICQNALGTEWPAGERDHVVRIKVERVTGRRLRYK